MSSTKISLDQLKHIAHLARLDIDPKKEDYLAQQLSETTDYIDILQTIDTKNIIPTFQTHGLKNVTRADVVDKSFTQEEALSQAPKTYNGYFQTHATIKK